MTTASFCLILIFSLLGFQAGVLLSKHKNPQTDARTCASCKYCDRYDDEEPCESCSLYSEWEEGTGE